MHKSQEEILDALAALNELPSYSQSVGVLGERAKRCKPGSKLSQERWDLQTIANNKAVELFSAIRFALKIALATAEKFDGKIDMNDILKASKLAKKDWEERGYLFKPQHKKV